MNAEQNENNRSEQETNAGEAESADDNKGAERDSGADEYERDESNRGERPDNLRRRSEWFQKRTGGQ